jgi:O-glycosyl hydrolase
MQAYADYLVEWACFCKQSGVKVTNIGFLNEPEFAASYAGMLSNGVQAADFGRTSGFRGLAPRETCLVPFPI